ncbi:MAG: ribosomal-processing cysteine protease Prp [Peptococcaceae bacterium]|jgi:uncharacterized protein YsxB (DUF464 family)|nr:ribosomal-processing cysteine protease Prp [Peptococcaceae bacterium]MDH7525538.1 ribosomal-processing cysteine protease Prp [Peptococcaceae bacterium]
MIEAIIYYVEPGCAPEGYNAGREAGGGKKRLIKGYVIEGHAGMAEPGYDLVCASVSALAQAALLGLDAHLSQKPGWKIDNEGYLECWLPDQLPAEEMSLAQAIIRTMELGLESIAEEYGTYLKVKKRRWTKCCSK